MNHRQRFLEILDFLKPYQRMWQNEIMLMYPNPLEGYPMDWIEDLRRFENKQDIIRLEKKDVFGLIENSSLIAFYKKIKELSALPGIPQYEKMPEEPYTWLFMIPKKQHEIRRLAPHLNHLYHTHQIDQVVDIGGGIGYLAQAINNQYRLKVTSLDMNPELQKTGVDIHRKNSKHPDNKVQYKNVKVEDQGEFVEILKQNVMPVGLHTCGRLALDIIKVSSAKKVPVLVNFGCCYQTLDKVELQNISEFAQKQDRLQMHTFALTLACRAHRKMDEKDFDLKQKVKYYRYAIHVLLHDEYGLKKPVTLGNSTPKLYAQPFGIYVQEQLKRIQVEPRHTEEELNAYFANPDLKVLIDRMLAAGLIRDALGRVLELYLQLDRAIYLEEQGYQVQVQEFFEEELSPRNIGITATRLP